MFRKTILIIAMVLLAGSFVQASKKDSTKVSLNHYSLTVGAGWVHFINNLEIGKDAADINSLGVSLKFFWEPEHLLSLGLETGFYRLYSLKSKSYTDLTGQASMSAMPFFLNIRMRVVDNFYLTAGAGLTLMFNKVTGIGDKVTATILSMSNYQLSGSYLYPLSKHWLVGGEFKVLYFGKANDWLYSVQAVCAFKL
jgi:hypothetical protein